MSIEWNFILHHTHVDLGYTGNREQACRDLVDMVDGAIDRVAEHAAAPGLSSSLGRRVWVRPSALEKTDELPWRSRPACRSRLVVQPARSRGGPCAASL